jgi:hypothetical protein
MCNLYSITTNQAAIIALFRVVNRYVGNLPPMSGVFPDYPAPVIRNTDNGTELVTMRWGMPPPPRTGGLPVTNIRNTFSPHWRGWLKPESRGLVPANSFAEYAPSPNGARNQGEHNDTEGARPARSCAAPVRFSAAGVVGHTPAGAAAAVRKNPRPRLWAHERGPPPLGEYPGWMVPE